MPAHAVDRRDDGLAQGHHEMRMAFPHQLADIGVAGSLHGGVADRGQVSHVGACAEGTPATGDDHGANVRVGFGSIEVRIEGGGQTAAPRVHALGPVQSQHDHPAVAQRVQHHVFRDSVRGAHHADLLNDSELRVCTL
jgi:hypothetical protein